jgi:hypothetical protein
MKADAWLRSRSTKAWHGSRRVTRVAREIRLLEQALKATNARTTVDAYDQDDAVMAN